MMKSCEDITLLIEKSKVEKLSIKERLQIKLHTRVCKLCHNYKVDSKFLDTMISKLKPKVAELTKKEKQTLTERIEQKVQSI